MLDSGSVDARRKKKTGKIKMMDVVNNDIQELVTREEEVFDQSTWRIPFCDPDGRSRKKKMKTNYNLSSLWHQKPIFLVNYHFQRAEQIWT